MGVEGLHQLQCSAPVPGSGPYGSSFRGAATPRTRNPCQQSMWRDGFRVRAWRRVPEW